MVKKKKIGRSLALSHWNMHSHNSDNNDSLLDFTTSIYIFYDKDKFTNFKRFTRGQELLYKIEVITIEGWEEISLPLRIEN